MGRVGVFKQLERLVVVAAALLWIGPSAHALVQCPNSYECFLNLPTWSQTNSNFSNAVLPPEDCTSVNRTAPPAPTPVFCTQSTTACADANFANLIMLSAESSAACQWGIMGSSGMPSGGYGTTQLDPWNIC